MPSVTVVDATGRTTETLELAGLEETIRVPLIHQSVVRELAARRAGTHSTRGRSEVSGGGRKPWRQKGTGRARQGSIRATQWKGGGKPFGPKPRTYDKSMPAGMRRAALREALAAKIAAGAVTVVDGFALAEPRTKLLTGWLGGLGVKPGTTLLVLAELDAAVKRAARNVPWLTLATALDASAYQLVRNDRVVFERDALLRFEETYRRRPRPAGARG
ncbi:MAG: 50S ribosomal protein L4 [Candidatus Rokubacteria bacterium]|nr:50S ribosomal protein L4 [Candidatus Rokubacteria bacterium]